MAGINNNLYPPLVSTYMPAFIYTQVCRVYFSISRYNSLNEMHHPGTDINSVDAVQVVVQNQRTNQSMLNEQLYPSGIKLASLKIDDTRSGDDKYYIQIFPSDMENGFILNEYYKVQLRFTSAAASDPPSAGIGIDNWLSVNLVHFSEWSTVVLVRGISMPTLELNDFSKDVQLTTFTLDDVVIAGKVSFEQNDSETLKSYRIQLYDANEVLIQDSGDIYVDSNLASRQIKYFFNYQFDSDADIIYTVAVQITTKNLYSWPEPKRYNFSVDKVNFTDFNAQISSIKDEWCGRIGVHLSSQQASSTSLNIVIRRTSSDSNFKKWEDIYRFSATPYVPLDFTWYDYTVESGVWYKYSAQIENSIGYKSTDVQLVNPIMIVPEDIYLNAQGEQIKIRFDPQISSFTYAISESRQETIGSKYPFIRRNGSINYRTFPLSGTITHFMDMKQNLIKASKQDVYQDSAELYERYNQNNRINDFNDQIYEKRFRDKVIQFLYKNNVKLFRSTTEGNILVKLMDINFTPNQTLHRQIYSFSCTVVEVDECTLQNLEKYYILDRGSYKNNQDYLSTIVGQIFRPTKSVYYKLYENKNYMDRVYNNDYQQSFGTSDLILNDITTKYQRLASERYIIIVDHLSYLRIEMTSPPYLINFNSEGIPYKIEDNTNGTDAQTLGYIVIINGNYIIINKDGRYELTDSSTQIKTLRFLYPKEKGCISYQAVFYQVENIAETPKSYSVFSKIGQFWGYFNVQDSLYRKIVNKYRQEFSQGVQGNVISLFKQNLQAIEAIRVTAAPNTVFYVRQIQDTDLERHVMNESGVLEFYDKKTVIQGLYFFGVHLDPALDPDAPRDWEFVETGITINSFNEVKKPIRNGVYTLALSTFGSVKPLNNNIPRLITDNSDLSDDQDQALDVLTNSAVLDSTQDKLIIDPSVSGWIQNSGYGNDLDEDQVNSLTDSLYQHVLTNYANNTQRCIYYNGSWYGFTSNNDVSMKTVEGIVDYYCRILQRRY